MEEQYMNTKRFHQRRLGGAAALAASILLLVGCATAAEPSEKPAASNGGGGGLAAAKAAVDELEANPALDIEPLPEPAEEGVSVAVVNCTVPSCLPEGAKEPAEALGWTLKDFPYDAGKGPSEVVAAMDSAINSKPDVIVVSQGFGAALIQEQIDAAVASGIKVINIGSSEDPPGYSACIQCTPAMEAQGHALGNVALADAGSQTSVGIITDMNYSSLVSMTEGAQSTVEENGEGSTSHVIELNVTDNPANNASRTVSYLQRNPDIEYLLYTSPDLLAGTSSALAAAGIDVKVIAVNPSNAGDVAMLESGDVHTWIGGESAEGSYMWRVFDAAARAVQGAPIEPKMPITAMRLITKDNPDPSLAPPTNFKEIYMTAWGVN
jgi:ribose transport system substrate-binding protein